MCEDNGVFLGILEDKFASGVEPHPFAIAVLQPEVERLDVFILSHCHEHTHDRWSTWLATIKLSCYSYMTDRLLTLSVAVSDFEQVLGVYKLVQGHRL